MTWKDILSSLAGVMAFMFAVVYAVVRPAYAIFYGRFGLTPSEAGVSETDVVSLGLSLSTYFGFLIALGVVQSALLFILGRWVARNWSSWIPARFRRRVPVLAWLSRKRLRVLTWIGVALVVVAVIIWAGAFMVGNSTAYWILVWNGFGPFFPMVWVPLALSSFGFGCAWVYFEQRFPWVAQNRMGMARASLAILLVVAGTALWHYTSGLWLDAFSSADSVAQGKGTSVYSSLRYGFAPDVRVLLLAGADPLSICSATRLTLVGHHGQSAVVVVVRRGTSADYAYTIELPSDSYVVAVPASEGSGLQKAIPTGVCMGATPSPRPVTTP